jgi:hypothetical protein
MRPIPRTKRYCLWYWIHWLIVSLAHCLAIPVIFLGMDNRRLDLWTWCSWVLFGWCIFHFIVQLIFEIHACCNARQEYEREFILFRILNVIFFEFEVLKMPNIIQRKI